MAKLFVPSGTPVHDNCGDTFSPTQLGLFDKLLATFLGIICPSLKVVDVKVNGSAARTATPNARTIAAAAIVFRRFCCENIRGPPSYLPTSLPAYFRVRPPSVIGAGLCIP